MYWYKPLLLLLLLLLLIFVRARFHFALIGGNLRAPSTGSHKGIGGGIQIPETLLQVLLPFPTRRQSASENLLVPNPPRFETRQIPAVWINPWYSPTSLNNSSTSRSLSLLPTRQRKKYGTMAGVKHWSTHNNSYAWQRHQTPVRTKSAFPRGLLLPRRVQSTPLSPSSTVDKW